MIALHWRLKNIIVWNCRIQSLKTLFAESGLWFLILHVSEVSSLAWQDSVLCITRSEWLEGHEERMMYAEITTDTETIVMTTRTVLIGRGRWSRPTIWQLMLAPQQYLHHHHIPITNTRKYQVLPRNYIPASLNTTQFWLLSVCSGVDWGLCLNQQVWKRKSNVLFCVYGLWPD